MTQTLGQKIIRTSFNPSTDSKVDEVKQLFADLYDRVHSIQFEENSNTPLDKEICILVSEAKRNIETAAMYAVKAMTGTRTA